MSKKGDREVDVFLREAERRWACLESYPGHLHRLLERRVQNGELVSPLPRLYARADLWSSLSPTMRTIFIAHGLQELHPDWVFCGTTAAVLHGLSVSWGVQREIEVVGTSGGRRTQTSGIVRRYVRGETPVTSFGAQVTPLLRTVFDCMRRLGFREGLAIADSALHLGLTTGDALCAYVQDMRGGYDGAGQALRTARFSDPRPENGMESIARATMFELGFARPDLQVPFDDPMNPGRTYYVDYCWTLPDGTIIIGEIDGGEKYANPLMSGGSPAVAMRRERRRESRITIDRPRIVRFSPEEAADIAYFNRLLETFGVPRDHKPLIDIPTGPTSELVPIEAYGLE